MRERGLIERMPRDCCVEGKTCNRHKSLCCPQGFLLGGRQFTPNLNAIQDYPVRNPRQFVNETARRCDSDVRTNNQVGRPRDCGHERRSKETNFHEWPEGGTSVIALFWL